MLLHMSTPETTICPYCGHAARHGAECERCRGLFEPLSRQASQNAMGPWYIRDEGNPFRPGCSYATLKMLASRGRVGPETILRGPSTRQFWMAARSVPGIAHLLGSCHACKAGVPADETHCPHCRASFEVETDRQYLGLAEVRPLPGQAATSEIARAASGVAAHAAVSSDSRANAPVQNRVVQVEFERPSMTRDDERPRDEDAYSPQSERRSKRRGLSSVVIGLIIASVLGMIVVATVAVAIAVSGVQQQTAPQGAAKTGP